MKQLLVLAAAAVLGAVLPAPTFAAEPDGRQLIEMPAAARATLRAEMLDNQLALHMIIGALGERNFTEAAEIAEQELGLSSMGKHRKLPQNARPGMFMPEDMRAIARDAHAVASDFAILAKAAKPSDIPKLLTSLQAVTGSCIACHRSYRTQ